MKTFIRFILLCFLSQGLVAHAGLTENSEKFYKKDQEYNQALEGIIVKFQNPMKDIDENLKRFNQLSILFNDFKKQNLEVGQKLLDKVNRGDPLSGDDLYSLRRNITTYYKMNQKMLDFAKLYNMGGFDLPENFAKVEEHLPLVKAQLIYISGHIQVLDHIEKMHELFYQSSGLFRRIIKKALKDSDHIGSKTLNDIIKMSKYTIEIGNGLKFSNQVILVRNISDELSKSLASDPLSLELINVIKTNDTATDISRGKRDFDVSFHAFADAVLNTFNTITNWLSSVFGNAMGAIRWRKGYFYKNDTIMTMMKNKLQPMDILLEKTPFSMTDKFIPGHFGHAALYLGTKEQLVALNMWEHPAIQPYQDDIEAGNVILEAVRSGVRLNTIEDFSNIDEYTILRKNDALTNVDAIIESISRGMDQMGKEYDFNFDVETLDKIVCSELIYIVFGQVHWPTKYRVGRASVTPDDIAEVLFQKNTKFNVEQYMTAPERHRFEEGSVVGLGRELNFELRSVDGMPIKDQADPENSFWKKTEKCYRVYNGDNVRDEFQTETQECKTTYTLEYYEERVVGN